MSVLDIEYNIENSYINDFYEYAKHQIIGDCHKLFNIPSSFLPHLYRNVRLFHFLINVKKIHHSRFDKLKENTLELINDEYKNKVEVTIDEKSKPGYYIISIFSYRKMFILYLKEI